MAMMRGTDEKSGSLFSYVDLEDRIPVKHPLRKIRQVVNDALASLDAEFQALYVDFGRASIAPERLIRASQIRARSGPARSGPARSRSCSRSGRSGS
jgi:hypothetical protein